MRVGFIVTKTPGETGFKTFLNLANLYLERDEINIYLMETEFTVERRTINLVSHPG